MHEELNKARAMLGMPFPEPGQEKVRAVKGVWRLIQKEDGRIYFRGPGRPDCLMPYSKENAEVCVYSALTKYDWELPSKVPG